MDKQNKRRLSVPCKKHDYDYVINIENRTKNRSEKAKKNETSEKHNKT